MSITPTSVGFTPGLAAPDAKPAGGATAPGFGDALKGMLESVETSSAEANQAIGRVLDGSGDVHEAMVALQKADISLQMTVQVRNKLVQAYQDIMRMPI